MAAEEEEEEPPPPALEGMGAWGGVVLRDWLALLPREPALVPWSIPLVLVALVAVLLFPPPVPLVVWPPLRK